MRLWKIFNKELKVQFSSIIIYICFIAMGAMLISEIVPKDWRYNARPMREVNFIYFQLQKDSRRGVSDNTFVSYDQCKKIKYSQSQIGKMQQIMDAMNPTNINDREILMNMTFSVTENELYQL